MERKLGEYFSAGVRRVWYIEPEIRSARVYRSEHDFTEIASDGALQGDDVLPGFELPLAQLFARVDGPPAA